jgi:hypothetical protein
MVTAGLWTKKDIDRLEAGQYRKILRATNKVSNKAILHTMTSMNLAGDAVMRLSRSARDHSTKQNRITKYFKEVPTDECTCHCHSRSNHANLTCIYPRTGETLWCCKKH